MCSKVTENKAYFILSVDVEFAWGFIEEILTNRIETFYPYIKLIPKSRIAVAYLLRLLDKYEIPATWAIVGGLLIDTYQNDIADYLSELYSNINILKFFRYEILKPLWYALEVIDQIAVARVPHEITSHSLTHPDFWKISREIAEIEVKESKRILREIYGVEPITFIFPKNHVNYLDILSKYGFQVFRDKVKNPMIHSTIEKIFQYLRPSNLVVIPKIKEGLWCIPGSLLFQVSDKVHLYKLYRDAIYNINYVVKNGGIFHVILHDYSLVPDETKKLFSKVINIVSRLCTKEKLRCITMRDLIYFLSNVDIGDN